MIRYKFLGSALIYSGPLAVMPIIQDPPVAPSITNWVSYNNSTDWILAGGSGSGPWVAFGDGRGNVSLALTASMAWYDDLTPNKIRITTDLPIDHIEIYFIEGGPLSPLLLEGITSGEELDISCPSAIEQIRFHSVSDQIFTISNIEYGYVS